MHRKETEMPVKALKCPCCGADVDIAPEVLLLKCKNCGTTLEYEDGVIRIHKTVRIVDEAGIAAQKVKLEKIAADERTDERNKNDLKWRITVTIGLLILLLGSLSMLNSIDANKLPAPANRSDSFKGEMLGKVEQIFEAAGFTNIKSFEDPTLDMMETDKLNTVTKITIDGDSQWNNEKYAANSSVLIYYATYKPNGNVKAPANNSDSYSYKKFEDVVDEFEKCGYTNITCTPLYDLTEGQEDYLGLVNNVTINGYSSWYNFLTGRSTFKRQDPVIIYYHAMKKAEE